MEKRREQRKKQLDWLATNTDNFTAQSNSHFACLREKSRQVENGLKLRYICTCRVRQFKILSSYLTALGTPMIIVAYLRAQHKLRTQCVLSLQSTVRVSKMYFNYELEKGEHLLMRTVQSTPYCHRSNQVSCQDIQYAHLITAFNTVGLDRSYITSKHANYSILV